MRTRPEQPASHDFKPRQLSNSSFGFQAHQNESTLGLNQETTIRAAGRVAKNAKIVAAKTVDEAVGMLRSGAAQAFALTHDSLPPFQKTLPGSRILDGAFQTTGVAVAVQKNRPAALAFVTRFIEAAKADGTVRHALDAAGLKDLSVAPPEPRR